MGTPHVLLCMILNILLTGKSTSLKCEDTWEKVGCFHDRVIPDRPLPFELLNHRDPTNYHWDGKMIDWGKWPESLHALACKCASLAKKAKYPYFGLQFYGECWSGPSRNYARDGGSKHCVGADFKPCKDSDRTECVGKAFTNYVYRVKEEPTINGGWSAWSPWSVCSASCNGGKRHRVRLCNNPLPQRGGSPCLGESSETKDCNTEKCEQICEQKLEIGIILDASTSVTKRNWLKTLEFVKTFSRLFVISPANVHFGIIKYSWIPRLQFTMSDRRYWNQKKFEERVSRIKYTYGGTRTDLAVKEAEKKLFCKKCKLRPGVPKTLVVLTDGKSNRGSAPLDKVTKNLKAQGVNILAIGVGEEVDYNELLAIASDKNKVFHLSQYSYLYDPMNRLLKEACIHETSKNHDKISGVSDVIIEDSQLPS